MTETPRKNNTMRNILIGGCVVVLGCVICGVVAMVATGGALFGILGGPAVAGVQFMEALKADNYAAAYALIHPDQQQSFGGSPEGLQQTLDELGILNVSDYTLSNIQVNNNQGYMTGTANIDGQVQSIRVDLQQSGSDWRIIGYGRE